MHHDSRRAAWAAPVLRSVSGRAAAATRPAMVSRGCRLAAAGALALAGALASAAPQFFSGRLDDPGNTALVGSDLGAAQFGSLQLVANNVALHPFTIDTAGSYDVISSGALALGSFDPYVTIFSGHGLGATFFASNFDNAFSVGGVFTLSLDFAAGDYTLAVGAFANMSFAENLGVGTLGDGFTGLGDPNVLDDGPYAITIDVGTPPQPVPEPPMAALGLAALTAWVAARGWRVRTRREPARRRAPARCSGSSRRSWRASVTTALLVLAAGPALAQRAALVQNVDDSLRNPYQEWQRTFCDNGSCSIVFSQVAPGRRRVVEYASCTTTSPTGLVFEVELSIAPVRKFTVYLPLQRSPSAQSRFHANGATQVFYEAGEAPYVVSSAASPGHVVFLACTVSGREISVP